MFDRLVDARLASLAETVDTLRPLVERIVAAEAEHARIAERLDDVASRFADRDARTAEKFLVVDRKFTENEAATARWFAERDAHAAQLEASRSDALRAAMASAEKAAVTQNQTIERTHEANRAATSKLLEQITSGLSTAAAATLDKFSQQTLLVQAVERSMEGKLVAARELMVQGDDSAKNMVHAIASRVAAIENRADAATRIERRGLDNGGYIVGIAGVAVAAVAALIAAAGQFHVSLR